MASTAAGARLTTAHRAAQLAVRARSLRGLVLLWRAVDPADLAETIDVFTQAAVLLAVDGHTDSAGTASRYFGLFRDAEGVPGVRPGVGLALPPSRAELAAQLRASALSGIIDARRAGRSILAAKADGLVRVAGTLTKLVLAGGRMTIINNVKADRQALGWQRVTSGDPCTFCRTLAARGAKYKTEKSASFEPHDHCGCTAEPLYRGDAVSPQTLQYQREYATAQAWARDNVTRTGATSNNALNNYRQWLAKGKPEPGQPTAGTPATPPGGITDV